MKKILYIPKRLAAEFKVMHKPTSRVLMKDTFRIVGTAVAAGIVLKVVDLGFASLLEFLLWVFA